MSTYHVVLAGGKCKLDDIRKKVMNKIPQNNQVIQGNLEMHIIWDKKNISSKQPLDKELLISLFRELLLTRKIIILILNFQTYCGVSAPVFTVRYGPGCPCFMLLHYLNSIIKFTLRGRAKLDT